MQTLNPRSRVVSVDPEVQGLVEGLADALSMDRALARAPHRSSAIERALGDERARNRTMLDVARVLRRDRDRLGDRLRYLGA
jgi:hypothetical protein